MIKKLNIVNTIPAYFKLMKKLNNNEELIKSISDYLDTITFNETITDLDFVANFNITTEEAIEVLDILSEMKILSKYTHVHICPLCGSMNGLIDSPIESINEFTCHACDKTYLTEDTCILSSFYTLRSQVISNEIHLYYAKWVEKIFDDSEQLFNKSIKVFGYTPADAESVIHEYYKPIGDIEIVEIEMENKKIL